MYEYSPNDVFNFAQSIHADYKQKGDELWFKACPYCQGGSGRDRETFSVNLKTGAYKCFRASCGKQGHFVELARDFDYHLQDELERTYRKLPQKTIETKPKAVEYFAKRGISEEIVKRYKITTRKDNENIIVFPFYDENNVMQFIKYRKADFQKGIDKNKEWTEKNTKPILFGMNLCEDYTRAVIVEGCPDCLAISECGIKNALSVPTGALGFTWLPHCYDWINKFDEVVVFGDCEHGSITLIEELSKRLKTKVKCVREEDYLHEKDANDILLKYGKEAVVKAVENAEIVPIKYVKRLSDVKAVNLMNLPKIRTNVPELDRVIKGFYYGQVILLSGKRGSGKSMMMSQLICEALEQNVTTFVYSGELPNYHFKNWIDLQLAGANHVEQITDEYGEPEYFVPTEEVKKINKWYADNIFVFDNSAIKDDEYTGLLPIIENAICRFNAKLICIDNLMTALDDDVKSDVFRQQSIFIRKLANMAKTFDVVIFLIAHPKKAMGEFNNDTVSGSSDITNAVDVVMNYERNTDEYDNECDSKLSVTKNRLTGRLITGEKKIKLFYDESCRRIYTATSNTKTKEYGCFEVKKRNEVDEVLEGLPY